ncbi:hypothetical protein D9619_009284 [Psilocybe cf. subviscida]|uniref:DUF6697 domain-containing protein n=1 Tax=Psilocybe cf. subviscida TaxID=2480587 RepID=A0A8H5BWF0_9AGAR|nr:hypothetical protein D9619_009284 [Psilocybe cf. subviscida]
MQQQPQIPPANRGTVTPPYIQEYSSDSDEDLDPNKAAFRPRREASIRARVVIANACGVKNMEQSSTVPSRRVKKDFGYGSGTHSVESFFKELEVDLKYDVKVETKPMAVVKKLDDEPSLTNGDLPVLGPGTSFSDAPPSPALAPTHPKKRAREVLDCVLLTSRKATPKRRKVDSPEDSASNVQDFAELDPMDSADEAEIFEAKMKKWKNDKVKKNEDRCLLPGTLRARIRPIGFDVQAQHITVDNVTREHMVTRQFMSETYGGSTQEVEPAIGELHRCDHSMRDFSYANTDYQPEAPEVPGAPGLWFSTEPGSDFGMRRVFTKIKDRTAKQDNRWLYVGQYDIRAANPSSITVAEWRAQPAAFHNCW